MPGLTRARIAAEYGWAVWAAVAVGGALTSGWLIVQAIGRLDGGFVGGVAAALLPGALGAAASALGAGAAALAAVAVGAAGATIVRLSVAVVAGAIVPTGVLAFVAPSPATALGAVVVAVAVVVQSATAERRLRGPSPAPGQTLREATPSLIGLLVALFGASVAGILIAEVLRAGCTFSTRGEGDGWSCPEGVQYGSGFVALVGVVVIVGSVGIAVATFRSRRAPLVLLPALALGVIVASLGWTLHPAVLVAETYPPMITTWLVWFLPATLAAFAAAALATATIGGRSRRATVLFRVALALLAGASLAQPTIAPATVLALGFLGTARLRIRDARDAPGP